MEGRFRCNSAGLDSQAAAGGLRANGHDCDVLPFVAFQCASPFEFPGDETRRSCGTLAGIGKTYDGRDPGTDWRRSLPASALE